MRLQWVLPRDVPAGLSVFGFSLAGSVLAVSLMPACVPPGVGLQLDLGYLD